nr:chlorophyll A/B-binding protein type III [Ipomoea batatas]GMD75945.1 chlorophyll A/B-binding protein type III [Ipomoea batatas]
MKDLKLREVKNGRLAMLATLGYFIQGLMTEPIAAPRNLLNHLWQHWSEIHILMMCLRLSPQHAVHCPCIIGFKYNSSGLEYGGGGNKRVAYAPWNGLANYS